MAKTIARAKAGSNDRATVGVRRGTRARARVMAITGAKTSGQG